MRFANNHKLHSLPSQARSTSFRFIQSSFTQQAAGHPLPLLCSPALSFGLRAVMFLHHALLADTPAAPFNNLHTHSKKSRQPLFGACLYPDTCFSCWHFLIVRIALIRSSFVLFAHTLPPARGLTSGRPLRSPRRLANPIVAIALLTHRNPNK